MGRSRRGRRNVERFGARESRPSQLDGSTPLPQIPDDIIRSNIIPRLPGKSLMRFKCLSKSWNSLVSDHYRLQPAKAVLISFEYSNESYLSRWREGIPSFYFMDCEDLIQMLSWKPMALRYLSEICIAGSCDGLLLIVVKTSFYLWNPVTKYFSHVLELDNLKAGDYDSFPSNSNYAITNSGICYDSCTGDYKVVIGLTDRSIYTPDCKYDPVLVAGLRNKGWRKLEFPYRCLKATSGVLFNGLLHWRANNNHDFCNYVPPNKIIAFDPKTDQVSEVPLPRNCTSKKQGIIRGLGVLESCLCMAFWDDQVIEVIAMKEYGVEESWTPLFEISNSDHSPFSMKFTLYTSELIPLLLMQNGHLLMARHGVDVPIFSYNPETMEYSDNYLKVSDELFCHGYPHLYRESLISPAGLEWNEKRHKAHSIGYRKGHYLDSDSEEEKSNAAKHFVDDSSEVELENFEDFMNDHFPYC